MAPPPKWVFAGESEEEEEEVVEEGRGDGDGDEEGEGERVGEEEGVGLGAGGGTLIKNSGTVQKFSVYQSHELSHCPGVIVTPFTSPPHVSPLYSTIYKII